MADGIALPSSRVHACSRGSLVSGWRPRVAFWESGGSGQGCPPSPPWGQVKEEASSRSQEGTDLGLHKNLLFSSTSGQRWFFQTAC